MDQYMHIDPTFITWPYFSIYESAECFLFKANPANPLNVCQYNSELFNK